MSAKTPNPWSELSSMMDELKKQYVKFIGVIKKKEKALIKGNSKVVRKVIKEEEKFINQLEELENERLKATAACLPDKEEQPTLRDVLEAAPDEEREALEQSAIELMETLNEVAIANRSNAELIDESLKYIDYNVNLLSSDRTRDNMYEGTGRMKDAGPKRRGILNREA